MSGEHICKKSDCKGQWLHQGTENLNHRHYRFEKQRHIRINHIHIIVLGSREIDREEGAEGKDKSNRYITRKVGSSREKRDNPDKVVEKDEEKRSAQIGRIAPVIFSNILLRHIMDHHHERLHKGGDACWRFAKNIMTLIPAGAEKENNENQKGR